MRRKEGEQMAWNKLFPPGYGFARAAGLLLAAGMIFLTACAEGGGEEVSSVTILKDGKVKSLIVESFDKSYYDQDELQQKILREAADYNKEAGEGTVSVEKVAAQDKVVRVEMTYADASSYASFNDGIFFLGSVKEAQDAGYDLNRVLSSAKDLKETVGMSDILAMTQMRLLITDRTEPVTLNGKAAYISDNVTMDKKLKTAFFDEESGELAYILFK